MLNLGRFRLATCLVQGQLVATQFTQRRSEATNLAFKYSPDISVSPTFIQADFYTGTYQLYQTTEF